MVVIERMITLASGQQMLARIVSIQTWVQDNGKVRVRAKWVSRLGAQAGIVDFEDVEPGTIGDVIDAWASEPPPETLKALGL